MFKYNGGHTVRKGTYWNAETGSMINVNRMGVLPGKESTVYYRVPFVFLFPFGMILGGLYVILLPLIGFVTGVSVVGKRAFGGVFSQVRKSVSFGWRPTEAYLAGKNKKESKENKE